jgi:polysaccharide biosynthesis protein PslH
MRILFITPYPPSHIRARSFGFIRQLAKAHQVTLLCLYVYMQETVDLQSLVDEGVTIHTYNESRVSRYLRCVLALLFARHIPLQVVYATAPKMREAVRSYVTSGLYDLVHIEFIRALGLLPQTNSIPIVWDAVDCVSNLYTLGAQHSATGMIKLLGRREAHLVREYELQQLYRFRHILVTAERERQALHAILQEQTHGDEQKSCATISVLPLGIDSVRFQSYNSTNRKDYLVFSGKMSFHANIAGALQLVREIMPHIWQKRPTLHVVLAGSNPPPSLLKLAEDPRISFTGYVNDLLPYIAQARVAVCPLPYAVGVQYKVLEAMALGIPVVASSQVATGIQAVAGRDLLVADDPQEFAEAVLRLYDDETLWQQLSEHSLRYVQTCHNWDRLMQKLLHVYGEAMENHDD